MRNLKHFKIVQLLKKILALKELNYSYNLTKLKLLSFKRKEGFILFTLKNLKYVNNGSFFKN